MSTQAHTLTSEGWDALRLIVALVTARTAGDVPVMNSLVREVPDDLARKALVFAASLLSTAIVSEPQCVRSWAATMGLRALAEDPSTDE